jgi:hypothetical protein
MQKVILTINGTKTEVIISNDMVLLDLFRKS